MKPNIIFDLDHTLFDSDKHEQLVIPKLLNLLNTDQPVFDIVDEKFMSQYSSPSEFNLEKYAQYLADEFEVKAADVLKIYLERSLYPLCLYPDVFSTLEVLSRSCNLYIFSSGKEPYQKLKIENSGIDRFFIKSNILIIDDKLVKKALKALPQEGFLIDDSKEVISIVSQQTNLQAILLDRNATQPSKSTIKSLSQIRQYL